MCGCAEVTLSLTALLLLVWAAPATAQTPGEIACRSTIAKNVSKYSKSVLKTQGRCHKKRSKGKVNLSVDCNEVAEADPKNRLENRRKQFRDSVGGIKDGCADAAAMLPQYGRCPSPGAASDDGGATTGIDDYSELAECMIALVDGLSRHVSLEAVGLPAAVPDKQMEKCQRRLGKTITKVIPQIVKDRARCQRDLDEAGNGLGYGCADADPKGRIAKAIDKGSAKIVKDCTIPVSFNQQREQLDSLDTCGDTVDQILACAINHAAVATGSGFSTMSYELPSSCRAGGIERTSYAGFGNQLTIGDFSAGWNGIGHGLDLTDRFIDRMLLNCDDDCANCDITLDTSKNVPDPYCRCVEDPTVACDVVDGPDPGDCTGVDSSCQCYFGPPAAITASGAPVCVLIPIKQPHVGTVDLGTGEWNNPVEVAAIIYLSGTFEHPCPFCDGDITINDGIRDGTCSGGTRDGLPCDTNSIQPTFGPSSYDCLPAAVGNISGDGLELALALNSTPGSLPFNLPCDSPGGDCPCRTCSGDTSIGCESDDRCAEFGAGTCTAGGGAGVQPNDCADRICSPEGICEAGPVNRFCDGQTYANGEGFITCVSDADCNATGAGSCTIEQRLPCFPNPITVAGRRGIFGAQMAGLGCLGVTSSVVINQGTGLPGPVRVALEADLEPRCGNSPSTPWEGPTGLNCTAVTTTTTTTLIPPLQCGDAFPACAAGACPPGQVCNTVGLACQCQTPGGTTTTTTMPPVQCTDSEPTCDGDCPPGSSCQLSGIECLCFPD